ncbi:MAG: hypothetical protein ACXW1N_07370 [Halobacteriota archaeon]|jgi:hypothetical protein
MAKKHNKDKKLHNSEEKLHNSHELDLSWQEVVDLPQEDEAEGGSVIVAKAPS